MFPAPLFRPELAPLTRGLKSIKGPLWAINCVFFSMSEPLPLLQDIYGLLITNYIWPTFYFAPGLTIQSMAQLFLGWRVTKCLEKSSGGGVGEGWVGWGALTGFCWVIHLSCTSLGTVADVVSKCSLATLQFCWECKRWSKHLMDLTAFWNEKILSRPEHKPTFDKSTLKNHLNVLANGLGVFMLDKISIELLSAIC